MRALAIAVHVYLKYFSPIFFIAIIFGYRPGILPISIVFILGFLCVVFVNFAKCASCGRKMFYYDYGNFSVFRSINALKFPPKRCSKCGHVF